jgi:cell division protein DivIC
VCRKRTDSQTAGPSPDAGGHGIGASASETQLSAFKFQLSVLHWRNVNFSKVILGVFGAAFVAVALWGVNFFVEMHREITVLRAQEEHNRQRLAETEAKLAAQEKYLDQLRHDPALVERLIRERLKYSKGDEIVIRFEDEKK